MRALRTELSKADDAPAGDSTTGRWLQVWGHRERLIRLARRRSVCQQDAEDAADEAILRAVQSRGIDPARLGSWMTSVTVRLCIDRHRQLARLTTEPTEQSDVRVQVPVDEHVCDQAEAAWVARQAAELLPERQAAALWLRAQGLTVAEVSRALGVSYRTAESLLGRARRSLRGAIGAAFGWIICSWHGLARIGHGTPVVALASTAALTVEAALMSIPYDLDTADGPAFGTRGINAVQVMDVAVLRDSALATSHGRKLAPILVEGHRTGPSDAPVSGDLAQEPDERPPSSISIIPPVPGTPGPPGNPPIVLVEVPINQPYVPVEVQQPPVREPLATEVDAPIEPAGA